MSQGLFQKIVKKKIKPVKLVRMTPDELASKELQQWRETEMKSVSTIVRRLLSPPFYSLRSSTLSALLLSPTFYSLHLSTLSALLLSPPFYSLRRCMRWCVATLMAAVGAGEDQEG